MYNTRCCIFFLLVIFLFACGGQYTCQNEWLRPGLKGYSYQQADTLIVKRFQKGSNFSVFVDSAIISYPQPVISPTDTTYFFSTDFIDGKHDVKLVNPFDQKTVSIADLKYETREGKKTWGCTREEACVSPLTSYTRDGISVSISNNPQLVQVVINR